MSDICVLGAGAWGTALAILYAEMGRRVVLWARDPAVAARLRESRENPRLPDERFPRELAVASTVSAAGVFVLAVPMQFLRPVLTFLPAGTAPLVLCCKGIEAGSGLLAPEVAAAVAPGRPVAVLTGPNFAREVAAGLPAAAVLAAEDGVRPALLAALRTPTLRLYGSGDLLGAALGGAAKNVVAIAAGVVMGAALGENARAALITRGLAEIARLSLALGGRHETLAGLSGLGDLMLTCTGPSSRNYSLGLELGRGRGLAEVLAERTGVTEGVATAPALLARATAAGVEMPIAAAVAALLAGERDVPATRVALMGRALRDE